MEYLQFEQAIKETQLISKLSNRPMVKLIMSNNGGYTPYIFLNEHYCNLDELLNEFYALETDAFYYMPEDSNIDEIINYFNNYGLDLYKEGGSWVYDCSYDMEVALSQKFLIILQVLTGFRYNKRPAQRT